MLFRKGVERRQEQAARPRLDGKEPQGRQGQAAGAVEMVEEAALGAVGEDLVMDVDEDLGVQRFYLEAGLVRDAVQQGEVVGVLAAHAVVEQAAAVRQRLIGRGGDFGKLKVRVTPGKHVAGAGDPDV